MKAKIALCLVTAVLASACAGPMTWDDKVFPQQPTYSGASSGTLVDHSAQRFETIESPGS